MLKFAAGLTNEGEIWETMSSCDESNLQSDDCDSTDTDFNLIRIEEQEDSISAEPVQKKSEFCLTFLIATFHSKLLLYYYYI